MQIEIRNDSVIVDGYVNAVERKSRKLKSRIGDFVEIIKKGAFTRAISRNDDVRILLNHDRSRDLGGTKDGNLTLNEDAIGLRARATITDADVIEKAKNGDLVGWSFGFVDVPEGVTRTVDNGITVREVNDLDLREVSLLDRTRTPAYEGTLVSVRSDDDVELHSDALLTEIEVRTAEEIQPQQEEILDDIDYTKYDKMIAEMKGEE